MLIEAPHQENARHRAKGPETLKMLLNLSWTMCREPLTTGLPHKRTDVPECSWLASDSWHKPETRCWDG